MDIVHLEFQKVPEILPEKTLCQVAFLCEQYQCVRIVAPWVEGWVEGPRRCLNTASWLYIYWAFGYDEESKDIGVELTDDIFFLKTQGRGMSSEKEPVGELLPPGILGVFPSSFHFCISSLRVFISPVLRSQRY